MITCSQKHQNHAGFLLQGGQGAGGRPPKTTFASLKGVCPPKIFQKIRKNNRNNSLLLKTMTYRPLLQI